MTIRIFCGEYAATISDRLAADGIPHTLDQAGTIKVTTDRIWIVRSIAAEFKVPAVQIDHGIFVAV